MIMEGISNIITFCVWFGTIILCVIIVAAGVFRWLSPSESRARRFNIMAWIAFSILCILGLIHYGTKELNRSMSSDEIAFLFFETAKKAIMGLMLGVIVISVLMLLIVVILCICDSLWIILQAKKGVTGSSPHIKAVKTPAVILAIAWGFIALFCVLPFLVGDQNRNNPIEIWKDGVCKIESLSDFDWLENRDADSISIPFPEDDLNDGGAVNSGSNDSANYSSGNLASYILIYVIVLGVGFAVTKILYSIIRHTLSESENINLIDEYSSPIALLAVGIAVLCTLKGGIGYKTIVSLLKSFGIVIVIFAIIIFTLEIIRLLINIRESFIRLEARYLFISLVGQTALLMLGVLNSIYGAVNSMISGGMDAKMYQIERKLRQKVIDAMDKAIDSKEKSADNEQMTNEKDHKTTFCPFDEKVTKK